jgi:hypothetical protein
MKKAIRTLAFRLGLKTTDTIIQPLARIVEDLDAYIDHQQAEAQAIKAATDALVKRSAVVAGNATTALRQRERIASLLGV